MFINDTGAGVDEASCACGERMNEGQLANIGMERKEMKVGRLHGR